MYKFGKNSSKKLSTADPLLVYIAQKVIGRSSVDFGISEGRRTLETQQSYYNAGKSNCDGIKNKSRHQSNPSTAIDIYAYVDGKANYEDKYMYYLIGLFDAVAKENDIKLTFGGWWKSLKDSPHIQIES